MKKELLLTTVAGILVLLLFYTAFSKLFDPRDFHDAMAKQPLPKWTQALLLKTLPATEIAASILLIIPRTRLAGFYASTFLMAAFTIYVGLGLAHMFKYVPCTCGGIFQNMSWANHFLINMGFLTVSISGIIIMKRPSKPKEITQASNIQYS